MESPEETANIDRPTVLSYEERRPRRPRIEKIPQSNKQLEERILAAQPLQKPSGLQRRADGNIYVINLHRKSERGGV